MTRAARKLHIAQPALSQSISQLESELGFVLFERHARGVTLTAAGEAFLPKARVALAADEDATTTARALARSARTSVSLGFVGSPPTVHCQDLLDTFSRAHPEFTITFRELPLVTGPIASSDQGCRCRPMPSAGGGAAGGSGPADP